jgi:teichuronic acid exporter
MNPSEKPPTNAALVRRGMAWNVIFQVIMLASNFGIMLVLARIISPDQHGVAASVAGIMALINCLNCGVFIAHAVNQGSEETPNWDAHWRAGLRIQLSLTVLLNLTALAFHFHPKFKDVAFLLHVGSIGLLIDTPNQMALALLRREMDFATMRKIQLVCVLLTAAISIAGGLSGWGALALILGANVFHGIPLGVYLLALRKWRPDGSWWRSPDWKSYRQSLQFGFQLSSASLLERGRTALETTILPIAFNFATLGLWNRAQVLFVTTGGRLTNMLVETIYPLLPKSRDLPEQFARHATLLLRGTLLFLIPSALFILVHGADLLLLLYGITWTDAVPFLPAATVFVAGASVNVILGFVLLAMNRLRLCFYGNLLVASLSLIALGIALWQKNSLLFAWVAAGSQWIGAGFLFVSAARYFEPRWIGSAVLPPVISATLAVTVTYSIMISAYRPDALLWRVFAATALFGSVYGLSLRCFFAHPLDSIVKRLPFAPHLRRLLLYPA